MEVDRGRVAISIRQVDSNQSSLYRPVRPAQPGQSPQLLGGTVALDIVYSYDNLAFSQSDFLSTWMQYQAARMRLQRELGVMELDEEGRWIDQPLPPVEEMLQDVEQASAMDPTVNPNTPDTVETDGMAEVEEDTEDEQLQGFDRLANKLADLQQRIEDAVLARAKERMDAELEEALKSDSEAPEETEETGESTETDD